MKNFVLVKLNCYWTIASSTGMLAFQVWTNMVKSP